MALLRDDFLVHAVSMDFFFERSYYGTLEWSLWVVCYKLLDGGISRVGPVSMAPRAGSERISVMQSQ